MTNIRVLSHTATYYRVTQSESYVLRKKKNGKKKRKKKIELINTTNTFMLRDIIICYYYWFALYSMESELLWCIVERCEEVRR